MRNFRRIAALAIAATALTPVIAPAAHAQTAKAERPLYKEAGQPIDARVEDLLGRMTLEEKVAQLVAIWLKKDAIQTPAGDFDPAKASAAFPNGLGMISRPSDRKGVAAGTANAGADVAANRGPVETATYINAAQKWSMERTRLGIPMIMHEEALHGLVAPGATSFPQSIALASTWNPGLLEKIFSVAAAEARARGANLVLAPVVDVARDPRWGRIEETYGEDPYLVSEMGLAAIRGFQGTTLPLARDKVFVTLKHMTGHGQPDNGTNVGPASLGERTLREDFFPPFESAVTQLPVRAVMASYNEIDGIPSHANKWLLHDVLRGEWGFKGAVVSDYFAIRELVTQHRMFKDVKDAGARAIDAGVDVETPDGEGFNFLVQLVREGKVSQGQIDNAVRRVLEMKFEGGLFENPYADAKLAAKRTNTPEAIALARQAARESVVLLKNANGLLPLDAAGIKRMAVIGTHARDTPIGGYSDVPNHVVSVLEAMQAEGKGKFQVDYSEGVRLTEGRVWAQDKVTLTDAATNARLRADAVAAAKDADVVVMVLGGNEALSREAWADEHLGDSDTLDLPGPQDQLAKEIFALGKPVVVILLNGRPYAVNYLAEKAPALIEGWYLGEQTGNALADVVFGRFNPGGKLPVSIARGVGQLPIYYNRKPTARRGYLFGDTTPLYPFGYGLSYSTFEMGAPVLGAGTIGVSDKVTVKVDVANTGKRAGDEVVQLYVRDDEASVTRPLIELKRFQRVTLQPGERKTVSFELTPQDLSLWNVQMKRVVEPGTFTISAGPNSVDLKSATLTVR
ncbi:MULTISPECIES: glycoside hydrolase family 3 N-terminal domain-containing protein [Sphingomonas]|uniref:glycoside hydrolase family 3 N-terminal domain-containing protein n=1 Tax=Sphingomonas TaxID=13687 RepID=UPI00096522D2|nr:MULTISPECIES: glycoside hydrolase family 3 N-terminal domain-containing protein [unclassified Sphingomonas]MBN8813700.1 glycoside hydrolase family 3 C-terminal domain-containing protein [Sphingomonas sp.]OJY51926.1 MAG: beta-glucosidase [Sphingomonas sp. 67-41]